MHRTRCYPRWLASVGLALGLGCGHGSITHQPIVLRDAQATDIGTVESLREVQCYGRWHTRATLKRSTPLVDEATHFWWGVHQRWPVGGEPVLGARAHDLHARDRVDTGSAAKAVGPHMFALRCGALSMIDVERNAAVELHGDERVRWTTLAANGDTLVAIGVLKGRRVLEDASEIVRVFAVDAEGVPQRRASIELRAGGDASTESGHTSIVGDTLVLVRRM
jgi:hypothetical protein